MKTAPSVLLIVGGALALLLTISIIWLALPDKPSVVALRNAGPEAVELSVTTTNPSSYSWRGTLQPGEKVSRRASFSDNSFQVDCRDSKTRRQSGHGYVTNGFSYSITLTFRGCEGVAYAETNFP